MNLRRLILLSATLAFATSAYADLKSAWQTKVNGYCSAVKAKDTASIEKILRGGFAPDFKYIPRQGSPMNLDQWIKQDVAQTKMVDKILKMTFTIDSLKEQGNRAKGMTTINYVALVKTQPNTRPGLLNVRGKSTMDMVKKNGKWWVSEIKEISGTQTFNGKPMN